jgi:hypothetical protein
MSLIGQYRKPDSWAEDEMGVTLGIKLKLPVKQREHTDYGNYYWVLNNVQQNSQIYQLRRSCRKLVLIA